MANKWWTEGCVRLEAKGGRWGVEREERVRACRRVKPGKVRRKLGPAGLASSSACRSPKDCAITCLEEGGCDGCRVQSQPGPRGRSGTGWRRTSRIRAQLGEQEEDSRAPTDQPQETSRRESAVVVTMTSYRERI
ncbi:unnamed protein product [Protopolystoma xenopodis]|uniref:Uncharacterized protein n=1 Tax=Protopolystoma xenopodis TaxID=117903 RepID=A0A3S5AZQ2_9PLAT|nr:unnamed protein product [Protopolystoma xenopodis]